MVCAWYFVDNGKNQRSPHRPLDESTLSLEQLTIDTGVLFFKVRDERVIGTSMTMQEFCDRRGYNYQDTITISPETLDNYDEMIAKFYEEHLHPDEEIRLVLEGGGYFDVRDHQDRMVRIAAEEGDMLVLPAGIYHRFTCDENDFIRARRLFSGVPVWTGYVRSATTDKMAVRRQYLLRMASRDTIGANTLQQIVA